MYKVTMITIVIKIEEIPGGKTRTAYTTSEIEPTQYEYIVDEIIRQCIQKVFKYVHQEELDDSGTGTTE